MVDGQGKPRDAPCCPCERRWCFAIPPQLFALKGVFAGILFCGLVLGKPDGIHVFISLLCEPHSHDVKKMCIAPGEPTP